MRARPTALLLTLMALLGGQLSHQVRHVHAQDALPPLSYICVMAGDEDVNEGKPGKCPKCGMELVPARIDLRYACPTHQAILSKTTGKCRFDGRELMPVTVTMHWICKEAPNQPLGDPGKCADGSARQLVEQLRAHADHNPRHGGQFFMAADQWHHLEGTYPSAGLFRAFMYDNFTKPFNVKDMTGRVVTREENGREIESFPLKASRDGTALEAQIKSAGAPSKEAPVKLIAKIRFDAKTQENRFDFTFTEFSKEPPTAPPASTTTGAKPPSAPATVAAGAARPNAAPATPAPTTPPLAAAAAPPATAPATAPAAEPISPMPSETAFTGMVVTDCKPNMSRTDALLLADNLPKNASDLVSLLTMCTDEVSTLIKDGQFGYIYQPTILSKDIALALETHAGDLPNAQRARAINNTKWFVLAAWELDYYGDLGNRDKIVESFDKYAAAAAEIKAAYAAK